LLLVLPARWILVDGRLGGLYRMTVEGPLMWVKMTAFGWPRRTDHASLSLQGRCRRLSRELSP